MTTDDFYMYLVQPELMNEQSLIDFKSLVQEQPAFQSAWILYLKNLMVLNDPNLSKELRRASIYIQDRRKLYMFLHQQTEKEYLEVFENDKIESEKEELLEIDYASNVPYQLEEKVQVDESLSDLVDSFRKAKKKKPDIIDDFLAKNSLIELDEKAKEHDEKDQNDEFISETLANIYARQAYYDKAIEVFEKLSLKYPEKNTYFAGQIEEIKKLKNK